MFRDDDARSPRCTDAATDAATITDSCQRPSKYDDWTFCFKRTIRSASCDAYKLLTHAERETDDVREDDTTRTRSAVMYDSLCQACTGNALSCIRAVDDMHGLTAWQLLYKKYNPKTMGGAIRLVGAVTHHPKVKELKHGGLGQVEEKGKVRKKDFGEDFSQTVRLGIITAMMPESIQEFGYFSLGITGEYGTIVAKIRALVSNKVAMADGPTPMDIDKLSVSYARVQTEYSDDDQEIDVVNMSIQCYGCGGWGHFKSKCPTSWAVMQEQHQAGSNGSKGLGKGGKSSAKGIGGFGKGGKGKGALLGRCLKCGDAGHR